MNDVYIVFKIVEHEATYLIAVFNNQAAASKYCNKLAEKDGVYYFVDRAALNESADDVERFDRLY